MPADALEDWAARLERHGVAIESRVTWRNGERSLYVRDPDGHSLERATPGVWGTCDPREGSAGGP